MFEPPIVEPRQPEHQEKSNASAHRLLDEKKIRAPMRIMRHDRRSAVKHDEPKRNETNRRYKKRPVRRKLYSHISIQHSASSSQREHSARLRRILNAES
jgi:hypothetical protein